MKHNLSKVEWEVVKRLRGGEFIVLTIDRQMVADLYGEVPSDKEMQEIADTIAEKLDNDFQDRLEDVLKAQGRNSTIR